MTSLLERTISIIAPHHCISCSKESNVLCGACAPQVFGETIEICVLCNKPAPDARICKTCSLQTSLRHVWVAAEYEGAAKALIRAFKFERLRAAYKPLAIAMSDALPCGMEDVLVVHIPTAPTRIRQRGYDQAKLLARELSAMRGWRHVAYLSRRHNLRQVGSSRVERFCQASEAFELHGDVRGMHVLLVDDVTTTGATLSAAAGLLMGAGASRVDAIVVAKHTLEQK